MYYHASKIKDLARLKPHVSNHGESWVYFSTKRENVLVYLSNAVEKYIKEKHNRPLKKYEKWASYGITSDGRVRIEEYYPNALEETFYGESGFIYYVNELEECQSLNSIKDVFVTQKEVAIEGCEFIQDALAEILKAEEEGLILVERFHEISEQKRQWIEKTIISEFKNTDNDDYKEFLLDKFIWLKDKI